LDFLESAIGGAQTIQGVVLRKARFWDKIAKVPINSRQNKVLNRLLEGFQGKLTSSKWAKLAKCSQDTAYRDINDLVDRDILKKDTAGGRSSSYSLADRYSFSEDEDEYPFCGTACW
jgi:Fic family protein